MKIYSTCPTCSEIKENDTRERTCSADINDKGIYLMKCNEGHDFYCIPTFEDYELLFEAGAYSLDSGNYVEAVSYFTNSLEKFRYFVILISDHYNQLSFEEIEKKRKLVKLSERKVGAFYQAYSYIMKRSPKEFDNGQVRFRNEVIHEGKIPSYEETKNYGIKIMDYIKEIQVELLRVLPHNVSLLPTLRFRVLEVIQHNPGVPVEHTHNYQFMLDFINASNNFDNDFDIRFSRSKMNKQFLFSLTNHE